MLVPEAQLRPEEFRCKRLVSLRPLPSLSARMSLTALGETPREHQPSRDLSLPGWVRTRPQIRFEMFKPGSGLTISQGAAGLGPLADARVCTWHGRRFPHLGDLLATHASHQAGRLESPSMHDAKRRKVYEETRTELVAALARKGDRKVGGAAAGDPAASGLEELAAMRDQALLMSLRHVKVEGMPSWFNLELTPTAFL